MTRSLMSRTNRRAGPADARQPFRNKETIMFNRLALALLAATIFSAPVMAQDNAKPSDTAKPSEHVHKASNGHAMHMKAKTPAKKPAATTGAAKS
jgi:hypothetical protein